jgi:hypothetical protein
MDTFAKKAWLVKLMYGRGRRPATRFYISGWERPSQVIAAVRTACGSSDDVIVFPLRELSQDEIITHRLIMQQTKELQNGNDARPDDAPPPVFEGSDARPDEAPPPVFEASGGQHVSSPREGQKPIREITAPEHEKPQTEVRRKYWRWWAWPKSL